MIIKHTPPVFPDFVIGIGVVNILILFPFNKRGMKRDKEDCRLVTASPKYGDIVELFISESEMVSSLNQK